MIWLIAYLAIGISNYSQFALRPGGGRLSGVTEAGFFIFLWPLQMLFLLLVWIHNGIGWLLGRITR